MPELPIYETVRKIPTGRMDRQGNRMMKSLQLLSAAVLRRNAVTSRGLERASKVARTNGHAFGPDVDVDEKLPLGFLECLFRVYVWNCVQSHMRNR